MVAELSKGRHPEAWERLASDESGEVERLHVWDDDRQKLTWMEASIEPLASRSQNGVDGAADLGAPETRLQALQRELSQREMQLRDAADRVAAGRLHLERALVEELLGDASLAEGYARKSLDDAPSAFAHALLRRIGYSHGPRHTLLEHLDGEIALLPADAPRAPLLAERARILEAAGETLDVVRAAWERALAADPKNPAALKGLEGALVAVVAASSAGPPAPALAAREALAAHFARMSEAYLGQPALAAWLLVERADLLDRELSQPDAAKAALQRALTLDGGIGPVRAACVAHAVVHRDAPWLVTLLEEEASLEGHAPRAARLEIDAGCVALGRLGDAGLGVALLERAVARDAAETSVRRRALDELVVLHETAGRSREALRIRRLRLASIDDLRTRAHELCAIAALHESVGDVTSAIAALEQALALVPRDAVVADALDLLLRARTQGPRASPALDTVRGEHCGRRRAREHLVRAARLAELHGDREQAMLHLRAALVSDPSHADAVESLLRMLAPDLARGAVDEVRARIAVHEHAAEHASDAARRIAHLEAIALLQEELLADPAAAAATYEAVLRVERRRASALVGLARTSARAGDFAGLARAQLEEADATTGERAEALRVRAAEALRVGDPERALGIVRDVLTRAPHHEEARRIEQRLHEAAGRWSQVDASIAARIERSGDSGSRVDLWLARAELQRTRLRSPVEALAALRAALAIDPGHPAAREALVALLEGAGDARSLREALVALAPESRRRRGERARSPEPPKSTSSCSSTTRRRRTSTLAPCGPHRVTSGSWSDARGSCCARRAPPEKLPPRGASSMNWLAQKRRSRANRRRQLPYEPSNGPCGPPATTRVSRECSRVKRTPSRRTRRSSERSGRAPRSRKGRSRTRTKERSSTPFSRWPRSTEPRWTPRCVRPFRECAAAMRSLAHALPRCSAPFSGAQWAPTRTACAPTSP